MKINELIEREKELKLEQERTKELYIKLCGAVEFCQALIEVENKKIESESKEKVKKKDG